MTDGDATDSRPEIPGESVTAADEAADEPTATEAYEVLVAEPGLGPVVEEHGPLELDPAEDPFRRLVVSILRQQVSMASAAAIRERMFEAMEVTPEGVLAADEAVLRDAGLSEAKVEYVRALADAWLERGYSQSYFDGMDNEAVAAELGEIRGIGPWTVDMFLMFGLGRPDVFPVGDLGIRKGMRALYGEEMTRAEMRERAEPWRPYRSYASLYLWRAYEG
ncbi:DNA-3-methyladenine glycosylase 2 family protein [Halobacteriales archaeon QS_1_68_20]|nr:MAG: DNA-3-methyladenine glycosylase 2 family protein [Halobacteriales archaeon QS_1_68_20]